MTTKIIDGRGQVRDWPASTDVAVKDMGCVAFRRYGCRSLEVLYSPSALTPMALLTAVDLLNGADLERITLASWTNDWQKCRFDNSAAAIKHLFAEPTKPEAARTRDFLSQRYALRAVTGDSVFGPIYEAWLTNPGSKGQSLMASVREASSGRYLEVDPGNDASKLVLDAVGEGYSIYGDGWKSVAVGGRFEDMPDYEYACRAAQGYREVFRTGQPIFEDITAIVHLLRAGRLLLKYRRVILPIGSGERPALLLGATLNQSVTRFDLGARDELGDVLQ